MCGHAHFSGGVFEKRYCRIVFLFALSFFFYSSLICYIHLIEVFPPSARLLPVPPPHLHSPPHSLFLRFPLENRQGFPGTEKSQEEHEVEWVGPGKNSETGKYDQNTVYNFFTHRQLDTVISTWLPLLCTCSHL